MQLKSMDYQGDVHNCIIESRLRKSQLDSILSDLNISQSIDCNPGEVVSLKVANNSVLGYLKEEFIDKMEGNCACIFANIYKHRNHFKIDVILRDKVLP